MTLCYVPRLRSTDPSAPGSGDGGPPESSIAEGSCPFLLDGQAGVRPLLREEQGEPRVCDGDVGRSLGSRSSARLKLRRPLRVGVKRFGLDGDRR